MRAVLALTLAEARMITRDTTAWATAIALPLVIGVAWALNDPPLGDGLGAIIGLQILVLLVFTLHTVGTMTLAARRQQLVLKRWRSSPAGDLSVLAGSIAVPTVLVLLQATVLTAISLVISGQRPHAPELLAVAVIVATATVAALTFVAASFSKSPEHAMITTLPLVATLAAGGMWALTTPTAEIGLPHLAIPGVAAIQLVELAWHGPTSGATPALLVEAAPALGTSLALTVAAAAAAARTFRWEPRT